MPDSLWSLFRENRRLLQCLFDAAARTIQEVFEKRFGKDTKFEFGMISTLHTFGRDLKWNPHIHMMVTEKAFHGKLEQFIGYKYETLRMKFQYHLLKRLKYQGVDKKLIDATYKKYPKGFVVEAKKSKLTPQQVAEYVTRYIARPVIAKKRILKFENDIVTICYNRHEDDKYIEENIPVMDFMERLVVHIPDKHFNMIRYYGIYAKVNGTPLAGRKRPKWRDKIIHEFHQDPLLCACGKIMKFVTLFPHGP